MRHSIGWVVIFIFGMLTMATAEYRMEQVHEFTVPANAGWDVRYVMNDSTLATVWAVDTTIYWQEELGGDTNRFEVNYQLDDEWESWAGNVSVYWVRPVDRPTHHCVVWHSLVYIDDFDYSRSFHMYCMFDLATGECLANSSMPDDYFSDRMGATVIWYRYSWLEAQPPLPNLSQMAYFIQSSSTDRWNYDGDHTSSEWLSTVHNWSMASWGLSSFLHAGNLSFCRGDSLNYAFSTDDGFRSYYVPDHSWRRTLVGRADFDSQEQLTDSTHGSFALAQQDASGTARIITNEGWALDWETLAPLWQNPEINGEGMWSIRMAATEDERLFRVGGHGRFSVYDASNGQMLDSTSTCRGYPEYVLDRPNGDEMVTYHSNDHKVRIYRVSCVQRNGLTCFVHPTDPSRIVLRWPSQAAVESWEVYSGADPTLINVLEETLPATATACTLAVEDERRFYEMRPVLGE